MNFLPATELRHRIPPRSGPILDPRFAVWLLLCWLLAPMSVAAQAQLWISSMPGGAKVLANGQAQGSTSSNPGEYLKLSLPAGTLMIDISLPGSGSGTPGAPGEGTPTTHEKFVTQTISLQTGTVQTVSLHLSAERPTPAFAQTVRQRFANVAPSADIVRVPAGRFAMGSDRHDANERPVHGVTVAAFELGKTEVTFDMWDACFAQGGCTHLPSDQGWGRGRQPVINVSWWDAQEYVAWLSKRTGKKFRLPSEAEWEYAARAGGPSGEAYATGICISSKQARFNGEVATVGCPKSDYLMRAVPVASFTPNAFGLHDMHGNVKEWVQDCWNTPYKNAPRDARARITGDCAQRMVRGGGWYGFADTLRSAKRYSDAPTYRNYGQGFRVARSIP